MANPSGGNGSGKAPLKGGNLRLAKAVENGLRPVP